MKRKLMKRLLTCTVLALVGSLGGVRATLAQDLVIERARIIVGNGEIIDEGSVVVRDGRIVSVSEGEAGVSGVPTLDAGGMTLMPGFIDAHRHIMRGDDEDWFRDEALDRMREFLETGYTALMSGGGPVPGIVELKRRVDSGELLGPRIITSGRANSNNTSPEEARAQVRANADAGVEIIKTSINLTPGGAEAETLAAIVDEARRHGLDVMAHAVTVPDMNAAVEAGVAKLVHTPHDSFMSASDAAKVADAGIENLSTIGFAVPLFGIFNDDNVPTFRDGSAWPQDILGTGSNAAGEKAVNGRTLWDAGVTYGFGTDTGYHPWEGLKHELRALNLMFSSVDLVRLMGPNTAAFIDMSDDLGTVEAGKLADLVLIDGDPFEGYWNLLNVKVTILGGRIVADRR